MLQVARYLNYVSTELVESFTTALILTTYIRKAK